MIIKSKDPCRTPDYTYRWHKWFAWYPVRVSRLQLVWMQRIERRYFETKYHYNSPLGPFQNREVEYRLKVKSKGQPS